jgi:hypothetical protein
MTLLRARFSALRFIRAVHSSVRLVNPQGDAQIVATLDASICMIVSPLLGGKRIRYSIISYYKNKYVTQLEKIYGMAFAIEIIFNALMRSLSSFPSLWFPTTSAAICLTG